MNSMEQQIQHLPEETQQSTLAHTIRALSTAVTVFACTQLLAPPARSEDAKVSAKPQAAESKEKEATHDLWTGETGKDGEIPKGTLSTFQCINEKGETETYTIRTAEDGTYFDVNGKPVKMLMPIFNEQAKINRVCRKMIPGKTKNDPEEIGLCIYGEISISNGIVRIPRSKFAENCRSLSQGKKVTIEVDAFLDEPFSATLVPLEQKK